METNNAIANAAPLEGAELDEALEQYAALMIRLRPNFGIKGQGAAFQGSIMTMGVVFPNHKEALNAAIPTLPVRKRLHAGDTQLRQMRTTAIGSSTAECPTCGKKSVDQGAGASLTQMTKLQTSVGALALTPGSIDLPAGPVTSDQVGTRVTYDGVHGPITTPTDEKWAGLLTTLPTLDEALNFYYTLAGKAYPAKAGRDHISVLKAIYSYDDKV